ncbi:segregation/condensation protein A [candidate division KSB1 bacterium]|nr:segregation/condensation protein A [candidate division KSB1 bacterium]
MPYRVQLQNFEGPLDLLLFLIKKNEVEIYDIPVADITQQYLEYLNMIELLDLDNASEFVLMAATLIRIKAQMLLPKPELEDDEEAEDPREELVRRLLEYQRYKEVAWEISDLEKEQRQHFARSAYSFNFEDDQDLEEEKLLGKEISIFDLISVFAEVIKRIPPRTEHIVEQISVTIEEQAEVIMALLEKQERVLLTEMLQKIKERIVVIVTFIALLDLVKSKQLQLNQNNPFAEIWIRKI